MNYDDLPAPKIPSHADHPPYYCFRCPPSGPTKPNTPQLLPGKELGRWGCPTCRTSHLGGINPGGRPPAPVATQGLAYVEANFAVDPFATADEPAA